MHENMIAQYVRHCAAMLKVTAWLGKQLFIMQLVIDEH